MAGAQLKFVIPILVVGLGGCTSIDVVKNDDNIKATGNSGTTRFHCPQITSASTRSFELSEIFEINFDSSKDCYELIIARNDFLPLGCKDNLSRRSVQWNGSSTCPSSRPCRSTHSKNSATISLGCDDNETAPIAINDIQSFTESESNSIPSHGVRLWPRVSNILSVRFSVMEYLRRDIRNLRASTLYAQSPGYHVTLDNVDFMPFAKLRLPLSRGGARVVVHDNFYAPRSQ